MNLYKQFKTDKEKEIGSGIVLKYADASITINRAGGANEKYRKQHNANLRRYGREIELGTLESDKDNLVMAELYADTVILAWENVCDESGEPLAFNRANVVKILTDLPELFRDLRNAATDAALFKAEVIEADLGKPANT